MKRFTIARKIDGRVTYAVAKDGKVTWTTDRAKATKFPRAVALKLGQQLANRTRLQLSVERVTSARSRARAGHQAGGQVAARRRRRKVKKNPDTNPTRKAVGAAVKLFRDFRGEEPTESIEVKLPTARALLTMGECTGIIYKTRRDGELEEYLHRFVRKKARPTLAVSSDGLQLFLLGGAYSVTDRGITDDA